MISREVTIDLTYYNELLKTQFESERINQELTNAEVEILHLKNTILHLKNTIEEIMKYVNEHLMSYQIEDLKDIINGVPEEQ